jgi:GT2 family glycosyltransferase
MRLSVIVVNWNSVDDLKECLRSLRAQTYPGVEILVVDNGSADGSPEVVASEFPECVLVRETENLGFAEGCNRGIARASGEWIAVLNNDAVAEPTWASALVEAAEKAPPSCGMLQSLMLYRSRPDIVNSTGIELTLWGGGRDRHEGRPRSSRLDPQEIFCPTAGAAAYRRSMLEAVRLSTGYFDRTHFMYYEDADLGWRGRLAGWGALFVPSSVVLHRWHGSTHRHGRSWLVVTANTNRLRALVKNASVPMLLFTSPWSLLVAGRVIRHGGLRSALSLGRALRESVGSRREVTRLIRRRRRDVELAWVRP